MNGTAIKNNKNSFPNDLDKTKRLEMSKKNNSNVNDGKKEQVKNLQSKILKKKGKVFICGAGPGDPRLITVRCLELIKNSDVVLYDRLVGQEVISQIPEKTEKIYVGRAAGDPTTNQDNTNVLMVKYAIEGKNVLRLKGGDPFIFGRGGEEAEYLLKNGIEFEIIPGITSAIGSAIYSGIPLTHRKYSSSVVIATGHEDPVKKRLSVNWKNLANIVDTMVILMGLENLNNILKQLEEGGLSKKTPIAIIERGTRKEQKTIVGTVGTITKKIEQNKVKPPAVIIIGKVVLLSKKLSWFKANID